MKQLYLFGLLLSLPYIGFSQGEFNNWYFGNHAGLNFSSGSPVVLTDCSPLFAAGYTNATVSDSLGNLLFYTDDHRVYTRNHTVMPNGNGLNVNDYQPMLPLKNLTDNSKYYLFTNDHTASPVSPNPRGLRYWIVDMNLNGGLGDIPAGQKNLVIPGGEHASNMVTGTRHHNLHDAWVITRDYTNDNYLSFLVTNSGINTPPAISHSTVPITVYPGGGTAKHRPC